MNLSKKLVPIPDYVLWVTNLSFRSYTEYALYRSLVKTVQHDLELARLFQIAS